MTKASTFRGPLPVVVQDKRDWSAKGQKALEPPSGPSSRTPDKPPSFESGLLGVMAVHERDKERDQGFGVALTQREREHERQRMFEDLQRQQLEI